MKLKFSFTPYRYTKTGQLAIAGFCDPHKDPTEDDLKLWMPDAENPPKDLDLLQARFLLAKVADQFCDLFVQEKMAMPENMSDSEFCSSLFQTNISVKNTHSMLSNFLQIEFI